MGLISFFNWETWLNDHLFRDPQFCNLYTMAISARPQPLYLTFPIWLMVSNDSCRTRCGLKGCFLLLLKCSWNKLVLTHVPFKLYPVSTLVKFLWFSCYNFHWSVVVCKFNPNLEIYCQPNFSKIKTKQVTQKILF